jgi:hypothetical protein
MSDPTPTPARSLRIRPEDVQSRLQAGERVLFLDARSALAWNAGTVKVARAVRIRPARLAVDPAWSREHLTVIY